MVYLLLIIGFVLLIKGADFFVDGCSSVARLLKVPSVIIGLTVVSIGTSLPEAAVSITASLAGNNSLSVSNITGSNLFNLLIVIGVCAMICPFDIDRIIAKRDMPICIGITAVLAAMLFNMKVSRFEGIILLLFLAAYIALLVSSALKNRTASEDENAKTLSPFMSIIYIIGGAAAIVAGGQITVDSASNIAKTFGMSDTLIGLTIVAVGTSLPEFVTSLVAAKKGESGLALGNAVGSSIFNIMFIVGMSAAISPLVINADALADTIILIFASILIYIFCRTGKRAVFWEGLVCTLFYIAYIAFAIYRNYCM